MSEKLEFPMEFKKCPCCGSERRIADIIQTQEVEKKKLAPETTMSIQGLNVIFADPTRVMLTVPVGNVRLDICADCGCYYAKFIDVSDQMVRMQPGRPAG